MSTTAIYSTTARLMFAFFHFNYDCLLMQLALSSSKIKLRFLQDTGFGIYEEFLHFIKKKEIFYYKTESEQSDRPIAYLVRHFIVYKMMNLCRLRYSCHLHNALSRFNICKANEHGL
jgi:hypothetical protein